MLLAGGMAFEEIQREYDRTPEDIRAVLKFASDLIEQESFHAFSTHSRTRVGWSTPIFRVRLLLP